MGWCSGTEIAEVVMKELPKEIPEYLRVDFFKKFIEVMWEHDWDCEADMDYMDPDFFKALGQLDPGMATSIEEMWASHAKD